MKERFSGFKTSAELESWKEHYDQMSRKHLEYLAAFRSPSPEWENEERKKLRDPNYLPENHEEVLRMFHSALGWNADDQQQEADRFLKEARLFEVWNKRYIRKLAGYLATRIELYGLNEGARILEVGAGDGKLSHFLSEALSRDIGKKMNITATDDQSWKIEPAFVVEMKSHQQALRDLKPHIVISSWMPYRRDFSSEFRKYPSVQEYILIGDPEVCGNDDTWQPAREDRFSIRYLDTSGDQICRTDLIEGCVLSFSSDDGNYQSKSGTRSFVRMK